MKEKYMENQEELKKLVNQIQELGDVREVVNDPQIRAELAQQGFSLDVLVNDEEPQVRLAVAQQGYGLDKLIDDEEWFVRANIASQGYGLERLISDESRFIFTCHN